MTISKQRFIDYESSCEPGLSFVRKMNGSTQALLVRDSHSHLWILKLRSELQGPNALANELLGSHLCEAVGLSVPECKVMHVADSFFDDSRTWFQFLDFDQRPLGGFHFASRFLPESSGKEVPEFLPTALTSKLNNATDCLGMFLFDIWAMHADKRQVLFLAEEGFIRATFIDHGHLFGGPGWKGQSFHVNGRWLQKVALEQYENQSMRDEWIRRLQETLPAALDTAIARIPCAWIQDDFYGLKGLFTDRLRRLGSISAEIVQSVRSIVEVSLASEQRIADAPIRILSERGTSSGF